MCRSTAIVTTKVALRIDRIREPTYIYDADPDLEPPAFQNQRATIAISIIAKNMQKSFANVIFILLLIVQKKMYRIIT